MGKHLGNRGGGPKEQLALLHGQPGVLERVVFDTLGILVVDADERRDLEGAILPGNALIDERTESIRRENRKAILSLV